MGAGRGLEQLHQGHGNGSTQQQGQQHQHGCDQRQHAIGSIIHNAGGQISTVGPLDIVVDGSKQEGPNEACEKLRTELDAQSIVLLEHHEDVGELNSRFIFIPLSMVLLLDHNDTQQRNHTGDNCKGHDGNTESGVEITNTFIHTGNDGDDGAGDHTHDHAHHTGSDHQLAALGAVQSQGAVNQVRSKEGLADIIQQISNNDPDYNQSRRTGDAFRNEEQSGQTQHFAQNGNDDEGLVLAVLTDLCTVHNPAFQRVVDCIEQTHANQQNATQDCTPGAETGIVSQVLHKPGGHQTCCNAVGKAHKGYAKIIRKSDAHGILYFFHISLPFSYSENQLQKHTNNF